jgi:hypothetical protein
MTSPQNSEGSSPRYSGNASVGGALRVFDEADHVAFMELVTLLHHYYLCADVYIY